MHMMDLIKENERLQKTNRWLTVSVILLLIIQLYDLLNKFFS